MKLFLKDELPFTSIVINHHGKTIQIDDVLVDTGSASSIFAVDELAKIDIIPQPDDKLYVIRGVGGIETVFSQVVDRIQLGDRHSDGFEIEVGGMDYGFNIRGILGMDFLLNIGAVINLRDLRVEFR